MNDKIERRKDIEQIVTKHLTDDFCNTYVFGNDVDDCIIEIMKYYEEEIGKLKAQTDEIRQADPLVMPKISPIVWEKRYSETEDSDKHNRWMRIGRINGMTVAIMTKHEVEGKPVRYMVRLPNNSGLESIQNEIITLSINEAMREAEKYICKYVRNFSV